jgi:LPPG:FO 2-phospho-L-lactate transferase
MGAAPKYLAITGGVGGAKLCLGLANILPPERLAFVVNTGDDFEHLGLHISPDVDTLMYTLSGLSNADTGWGRAGETWNFIKALAELGGETWFKLGDADLAVHVRRTQMLNAGDKLTSITNELARSVGIEHAIMPMSDEPVKTLINTTAGRLSFQHYFVRDRCGPQVTGFEFANAARARITPEIDAWLSAPDLAGIIICPSNPYLSIDPILATGGLRARLEIFPVPIVAVSPIVGGEAIKGPTAKIMRELGVPGTAPAVAAHYQGILDGFILDEQDAASEAAVRDLGLETVVAQTVMVNLQDRIDLAHLAIEFLDQLRN